MIQTAPTSAKARIDFNEHDYFDKISRYLMSFHYFKPRLTDLRVLLVIAALVSLCISSNVGPRFLPLPGVIDRVEQPRENDGGVSRSHGPQAESFRVPMMAQRRADREAPPQPLAALPKLGFVSPNEACFAAECSQQSFLFTSTSVSRPSGRAPPRLT